LKTNVTKTSTVNNNVLVYPTLETNNVECGKQQELSGTLIIYNSLGKPVKSLSVSGAKINMPIEDLPAGLYILKINDNKIRFSVVK
jgi:hypothetical protein